MKAALPGFTSCTDRLVGVLGAAADQQQVVLMHHLAILTTLEVICQVNVRRVAAPPCGELGLVPALGSNNNSCYQTQTCEATLAACQSGCSHVTVLEGWQRSPPRQYAVCLFCLTHMSAMAMLTSAHTR